MYFARLLAGQGIGRAVCPSNSAVWSAYTICALPLVAKLDALRRTGDLGGKRAAYLGRTLQGHRARKLGLCGHAGIGGNISRLIHRTNRVNIGPISIRLLNRPGNDWCTAQVGTFGIDLLEFSGGSRLFCKPLRQAYCHTAILYNIVLIFRYGFSFRIQSTVLQIQLKCFCISARNIRNLSKKRHGADICSSHRRRYEGHRPLVLYVNILIRTADHHTSGIAVLGSERHFTGVDNLTFTIRHQADAHGIKILPCGPVGVTLGGCFRSLCCDSQRAGIGEVKHTARTPVNARQCTAANRTGTYTGVTNRDSD